MIGHLVREVRRQRAALDADSLAELRELEQLEAEARAKRRNIGQVSRRRRGAVPSGQPLPVAAPERQVYLPPKGDIARSFFGRVVR